jgi:phosphatidylinositol phospholipase C delta
MVVNISESALSKLLPHRLQHILEHNTRFAMRVYPKGIRVFSRNLNPSPFWRSGAQICALNFQVFDRGVQMNNALFAGSNGWVLKPAELRKDETGAKERTGKVKLRVEVKGATNLPIPKVAFDRFG